MRTRAAVSSKSFRRCSLRSATRPAPSNGRIFASPQPYVPATDVRFLLAICLLGREGAAAGRPETFLARGPLKIVLDF